LMVYFNHTGKERTSFEHHKIIVRRKVESKLSPLSYGVMTTFIITHFIVGPTDEHDNKKTCFGGLEG